MTAAEVPIVLRLSKLSDAGLRHAFTTVAAGDFSAAAETTPGGAAALAGLAREVGFDPQMTVTAEQVHGATVAVAHRCPSCGPGRRIPHTDGLITDEPWPLLVTVADCFPVILFEPTARVVAAVHCGWRGTVAGILPRAIARVAREAGAGVSGILVGIGPGICGGCYTVGDELVQAAFAAGLGAHVLAGAVGTERRFDIAGALRAQMLAVGIPTGNIEALGRCTFEDAGLFSYRRDATTSRMAAVAALDG